MKQIDEGLLPSEVLVLGRVESMVSPILQNSTLDEQKTHYHKLLLNYFVEGVNSNKRIPYRLLKFISHEFETTMNSGEFSFYLDKKILNKNKKRHKETLIKTIGHAIVSVFYKGFRCGYSYKALGIVIANGKLTLNSKVIMTESEIKNAVDKYNGQLHNTQLMLLNGFLSGYKNASDLKDPSDLVRHTTPYEPDDKHTYEKTKDLILEYLMHNIEGCSFTFGDFKGLRTFFYPKEEKLVSISENSHTFTDNGIQITKLDDIKDAFKLSDSPLLSDLFNNHSNIPLLLVTEESWQESPTSFFKSFKQTKTIDLIAEKIEELNRRLEA